MNKLNREEQELSDAFDAGVFKSDLSPKRRALIESSAANTFKKDKRINIRISGSDLSAIQRRAMEEGVPYQTLVTSILHKFASGTLYDVTANKSFSKQFSH
jgi:predicted DNA binding CopG/RHH family protein